MNDFPIDFIETLWIEAVAAEIVHNVVEDSERSYVNLIHLKVEKLFVIQKNTSKFYVKIAVFVS